MAGSPEAVCIRRQPPAGTATAWRCKQVMGKGQQEQRQDVAVEGPPEGESKAGSRRAPSSAAFSASMRDSSGWLSALSACTYVDSKARRKPWVLRWHAGSSGSSQRLHVGWLTPHCQQEIDSGRTVCLSCAEQHTIASPGPTAGPQNSDGGLTLVAASSTPLHDDFHVHLALTWADSRPPRMRMVVSKRLTSEGAPTSRWSASHLQFRACI